MFDKRDGIGGCNRLAKICFSYVALPGSSDSSPPLHFCVDLTRNYYISTEVYIKLYMRGISGYRNVVSSNFLRLSHGKSRHFETRWILIMYSTPSLTVPTSINWFLSLPSSLQTCLHELEKQFSDSHRVKRLSGMRLEALER